MEKTLEDAFDVILKVNTNALFCMFFFAFLKIMRKFLRFKLYKIAARGLS